MRWAEGSLRRRLIIGLLAPLLLVGAIALFAAHRDARRATNEVYDRVLLGSALAIGDRIVVGKDQTIEVDLPYVALEMLTSAAQDRVFYRIEGPETTFITGYRDLPAPEAASLPGQPLFYDATYRGKPIRVVALVGAAPSSLNPQLFRVLVAETTGARRALAQDMLIRSALRQSALIAVAGLVVWFGARLALRPLARLEQALERRSLNDLRPITHVVPREVRHLIDAINHFMARLDEAIQALRRFTGNASHQLRTPLSVVKTQISLARRATTAEEADELLAAADKAASDADRVLAQLLLLARVEVAATDAAVNDTLDLAKLAEETTRAQVPLALRAGLDLGFAAEDGGAEIRADPLLISELLRNLIDNAVTHAGARVTATVRVRMEDDTVLLEVEDDGCGIPPASRGTAMERFVRLEGERRSGAGLGLAIVAEIAGLWGGELSLHDGASGQGLCARVAFPRPRIKASSPSSRIPTATRSN